MILAFSVCQRIFFVQESLPTYSPTQFSFLDSKFAAYPVVMTHIAMENHYDYIGKSTMIPMNGPFSMNISYVTLPEGIYLTAAIYISEKAEASCEVVHEQKHLILTLAQTW